MPKPPTTFSIALLPFAFTACATLDAYFDAHENSKTVMQLQVGRDISNPNLTRNRYRERLVGVKPLQNGIVEEEFLSGRDLRCRVFFTFDEQSQKIVGWRYEGTKDECAIVP